MTLKEVKCAIGDLLTNVHRCKNEIKFIKDNTQNNIDNLNARIINLESKLKTIQEEL